MDSQAYTRKELMQAGSGFPEKGIYCQKCKTLIPVFAEMTDDIYARLIQLINEDRRAMATQELKMAMGCPLTFAKIWVAHRGRPEPEYPGQPCPFCGKPLRTSLAKQCPHCFQDWHGVGMFLRF